MKKVSTLALCLLLIGTAAMAQATPDKTDVRQNAQRSRIIHGTHNGSISSREAHLLRKQQQHIRRAECRVEADGVVTPAEKRFINHKQNKANHFIRRAKHNSIERKG